MVSHERLAVQNGPEDLLGRFINSSGTSAVEFDKAQGHTGGPPTAEQWESATREKLSAMSSSFEYIVHDVSAMVHAPIAAVT